MKSLIIILNFILLLSCGQHHKSGSNKSADTTSSSSEPSSTNSSSAASSNPLIGTWKSNCVDSSVTQEAYKSDGNQTVTTFSYDDTNCTVLDAVFTGNRTYKISDADIDYIYVNVTMEVKNQRMADAFNSSDSFGFSSWTINTPRDVTGSIIDPNDPNSTSYSSGDKLFQIFKVSGKTLYFGDTTKDDGSTADKRPGHYNLDIGFIKE